MTGVCRRMSLRVGETPARHMAALEVVLVSGATERALLQGHTLKPLGWAPEGLLKTLKALFPAGGRVVGETLEEPNGLPDCGVDLDVAVEPGADEDDEYLLS